MTETILVASQIKEVRAPKLTVFETGEVVGAGRLYLLSIAVLGAVTKSALIFRSNKIVLASPGEAARVRSVHKEASRLRFVFPDDREDAGLREGFIIFTSAKVFFGSSSHKKDQKK